MIAVGHAFDTFPQDYLTKKIEKLWGYLVLKQNTLYISYVKYMTTEQEANERVCSKFNGSVLKFNHRLTVEYLVRGDIRRKWRFL